jgi:iron complex outermembrane receptor protein
LRIHARLGTGYGTPTNSSFFVTPQGIYGNNIQLKAQTNVGIDLGADWFIARNVELSVTGFYERFTNENVNQSPGAGLLSYTFNAPSSAHRGLVAGLNWHPFPKLASGLRFRAAYQYDAQIYRDYTEQLSAGNFSIPFVRSGNRIPGVVPNNLNARLIYDKPSGRYGNLGTYLETNYRSDFWLDNGNLLAAPSATLFNLDVHYDPAPGHGFMVEDAFLLRSAKPRQSTVCRIGEQYLQHRQFHYRRTGWRGNSNLRYGFDLCGRSAVVHRRLPHQVLISLTS